MYGALFPLTLSFLLAFVKLLKSTKEEVGSNDRIGKWFSSGRTVYVCRISAGRESGRRKLYIQLLRQVGAGNRFLFFS